VLTACWIALTVVGVGVQKRTVDISKD